ncbi:hypothetical protein [Lishizhenia sp.]|uniref:hypothetical protein n=1 Tax=Lishizhenia sp. TaxID=2497594 RepID=UPI00299D01CC|nr:hypothetical protein [Lishizhenia sp.]MDX1446896.1 hypothetical protein [Lishizhenia sp.]
MIRFVLLISLLLLVSNVQAQRNVKDTVIGTPYVGIQYTGAFPQADLAERFGFFNQIGTFAGYKTSKNWIYGFDGNYYFGGIIKDRSLLSNFVDPNGIISEAEAGNSGTVLLFMRGFNANFSIGKIFPVLSPNPNSGLMVQLGAGYLLHKYRIETNDDFIPQFENDYRKGYDRLTIGVNTSQFVGYSFMANTGVYNFYAGLYFQQGFTRNQRDLNWDQPDVPVSKDLRFDHQIGLRAGWLIPIYKRQPKDFYLN